MKAHLYHGLGPTEISRIIVKPDGSPISQGRVSQVVAKLEDNPDWRGEREDVYVYVYIYIYMYMYMYMYMYI